MSITLGDIFIKFRGDTKPLQQDVDRAKSIARGGAVDLGGVLNVALGTALAGGISAVVNGIGQIGSGLFDGVKAGLGFNNSMEQTRAKLMAFTKSGAETDRILEMIRVRAAKTPFAFEEMATATASLLPAAKASGVGLEDLIKQAEILAASNPSQGLEGAAFALKEAVSGDFTSIIERFNLPRKFINDLRAQGIPDIEAVGQAMQAMGLDASLVSNMAETAQGRWSTFTDTLTNLAGILTQPIFATFSGGLASVNSWLEKNQEKMTAFAGSIAGEVGQAISQVVTLIANPNVKGVEGGPGWFEPIKTGIVAVRDFVIQAEPIVTGFFTKLGEIGPGVGALVGDAFTRIGEALDRIIVAFGGTTTGASGTEIALGLLQVVLDAIVVGVQAFSLALEASSFMTANMAEGISTLVDLWNDLVTAVQNATNIQLPAWLTVNPGNIGASINSAIGDVGKLMSSIPNLPNLPMGGGIYNAPAAAAAAAAGPQTIQVQIDGAVVAEVVSDRMGRNLAQRSRF
jgi:hypothetical protein